MHKYGGCSCDCREGVRCARRRGWDGGGCCCCILLSAASSNHPVLLERRLLFSVFVCVCVCACVRVCVARESRRRSMIYRSSVRRRSHVEA